MLSMDFFYCLFWISGFAVIWFYTDWFVYYTQLFGIAENTRLEYSKFVRHNKDKYFPDFLYEKSFKTDNRFAKFFLKLLGCPYCITLWFSIIGAFVLNNLVLIAPLYILSLFIFLQIRKLI